jgi:octaprenyl-diphosphate synthase
MSSTGSPAFFDSSRQTPALSSLRAPVQHDLDQFRDFFKNALKTDEAALNLLLRYLLRTKGKELRPLLVFYAARLLGTPGESTQVAAAMVELLHTATLIHDDVIDEADTRRGFATINKIWKNKAGVLLGDYLLSRGLLIAINHGRFDMLKTLSVAVKRMSEAEIAQLKASKLLNITKAGYFDIIAGKTASLLATCCEAGAQSIENTTPEDHARLRAFGENLGIAFQIRDDLFDYEKLDTGKSAGTDIKERKITLPLLEALAQADQRTSRQFFKTIRIKEKTNAQIEEVISFVQANRGDVKARDAMNMYAEKAVEAISPYSGHAFYPFMCDLARFVVERTK